MYLFHIPSHPIPPPLPLSVLWFHLPQRFLSLCSRLPTGVRLPLTTLCRFPFHHLFSSDQCHKQTLLSVCVSSLPCCSDSPTASYDHYPIKISSLLCLAATPSRDAEVALRQTNHVVVVVVVVVVAGGWDSENQELSHLECWIQSVGSFGLGFLLLLLL